MMIRVLILILIFSNYLNKSFGQGNLPLFKIINLTDALDDYSPNLVTEKPKAVSGNYYIQNKHIVDQLKLKNQSPIIANKTNANGPTPTLLNSFVANTTNGTPTDNSMAIGNNGKIISVCNTNIRIYNDTGGKFLLSKSLGAFASSVGTLTRYYDPKAIYDPVHDRFIVVFLEGTLHNNSLIIVCFSQTNDPTGKWNCYKVPGNQENDTTWTDYPILAISADDAFITVNKLHDNMGWQDGFVKSVIWQIDLNSGYQGDSLKFVYHSNNTFNNKPLWSMCPVQGGTEPTKGFMYFLTVRPADMSNDSVFLTTIDNTVQSGNVKIRFDLFKTDKNYGIPASAFQPGNQWLQTNDCRVLGAIFENGNIQYVQTNNDTNTYRSSIFHGVFNPTINNQSIKGNWITHDSLEMAYPNIAYVGNGAGDHGSVITCSYANKNTFPGTCAIYVNRDLDGYSSMLNCKSGDSYINVMTDTLERWGDYTGIQRRYNKTGECWMSGSFGDVSKALKTVVASVQNNDPKLAIQDNHLNAKFIAFPNPAQENISFEFENSKSEELIFIIYNILGKQVVPLYKDYAYQGKNRFSFNIENFTNGHYILQISNTKSSIIKNIPFIVNH